MEKINLKKLNELLKKEEKLFVYFSTEWCGECKMNKLVFDKFDDEKLDIKFVSIDVDEHELWSEDNNAFFKIKEVPTFKGFLKKKEIFHKANFTSEPDLKILINKFK